MPATGPEGEQALSAVSSHPRQQDGRARLGPVLGDAPEEDIDARPEKEVFRFLTVGQRAILGEHEMVIGAGNEDVASERLLALLGHPHGPSGPVAKPFCQPRGEGHVDVLHHHDGDVPVDRQRLEDFGDRLRPPGGGPDDEQLRRAGGGSHAGRAPGIGGSADEFPDHGDLVNERLRTLNLPRRSEDRRVDGVKRAMPHRLVDERDVAAHGRRDDEDRARGREHDLPGGLDAVHVRHEQVHENQVGAVTFRSRHRLDAIAGRPGDLMIRQTGDNPAQGLARGPHIVDDSDSHSAPPPRLPTTVTRSARRSGR